MQLELGTGSFAVRLDGALDGCLGNINIQIRICGKVLAFCNFSNKHVDIHLVVFRW